jgi:hypothetical protein
VRYPDGTVRRLTDVHAGRVLRVSR